MDSVGLQRAHESGRECGGIRREVSGFDQCMCVKFSIVRRYSKMTPNASGGCAGYSLCTAVGNVDRRGCCSGTQCAGSQRMKTHHGHGLRMHLKESSWLQEMSRI